MEQRLDEILMQVTQQANGGVHGLLNSVFGFLQRRTDFFYEAEPGDNMGFPPQMAESLVYQFFKKYQEVHQKKFPSKGEALKKRWEEYQKAADATKKEKEVAAANKKDEPAPKVEEIKEEKKVESVPAAAAKTQAKPADNKPKQQVEKKQEPEPKKKVDPSMEKISTYNGAETDKYNWSQSISEVTLQVPLPEGTVSKMLDVKIETKKLRVAIKGQANPILEGELCEKVKVADSFWNVEDKKFLNINFEKAYEAIWKCILLGDSEIDTKTVDNSKRIEEFDLETQGHLQKVLYEQERKKRGLPTTEEEEQQKMMEKIMAAQGNPMQGVPYDPKKYGKNQAMPNSPAPPFNM